MVYRYVLDYVEMCGIYLISNNPYGNKPHPASYGPTWHLRATKIEGLILPRSSKNKTPNPKRHKTQKLGPALPLTNSWTSLTLNSLSFSSFPLNYKNFFQACYSRFF